jgi:hypothetical protein
MMSGDIDPPSIDILLLEMDENRHKEDQESMSIQDWYGFSVQGSNR